jgi:RNA polymerase sigma factor (TIGR02999 family)
MNPAPSAEITMLLQAWSQGNQAAFESLLPIVYGELRRMAHRYMRREGEGQTLQTTALVNEAYLRLVAVDRVDWKGRAHFFAVSAQMMRRILVDRARARSREKRGGNVKALNL